MRKLLTSLFIVFPFLLFGADYYWVNGSGNWSDTSHWATTSGGNIHHPNLPGLYDNVYFDASSFTATNQTVNLDISSAHCKNMNWTGVSFVPSFYSTPSDTLSLYGNLILSPNMKNNFFGSIKFKSSNQAVCLINLQGHKLKNDCYILGDSCVLISDLNIEKNLYFINGALNTNSHNISFNSFNPDTSYQQSIAINQPALYGQDCLTCYSSFFLNSQFRNYFTGTIIFKATSIDTNYINTSGFLLASDCYFEGNGLIELKGDFRTTKSVYFNLGKLHTKDYKFSCDGFSSLSSYARELDFGSSDIEITGHGVVWQLSPALLSFNAQQSKMIFSYTGNDTVYFDPSSDELNYYNIEFQCNKASITQGASLHNLILQASTEVLFKAGDEYRLNDIVSYGHCGGFVYLHSDDKGNAFNMKKSSGSINTAFIRLQDVHSSGGAVFNALNSLDEGNVSGWNITEPVDTQIMYWVSGSGKWSDVSHWSYSSGGTAASCLPGPNNPVVFDKNSFSSQDTVFIDRNTFCQSMYWDSLQHPVVLEGEDHFMDIRGSLSLDKNIQNEFSGPVYLSSQSQDSVFCDSVRIQGDLYFTGGSYRVVDSFVSSADVYLSQANLKLCGNTFTCAHFISNDQTNRILDLGSANIHLSGADTVWQIDAENLVFSAAQSSIHLFNEGTDEVVFKCAKQKLNKVWLETAHVKLIDSDSIMELISLSAKSLCLNAATCLNVDSFAIQSDCSSPFVLKADDIFGDSATINKMGYPLLSLDYVTINNVCADTSHGAVYMANHAIVRNNTNGWNTNPSTTSSTYYWVNDGGNWSDTSHWSLSSGGYSVLCLPSAKDVVVFDSNSFSGSGEKVVVDIEANMRSLHFDSIQNKVEVFMKNDLFVNGSIFLHDSLQIVSENTDYSIYIIPDSSAEINPNGASELQANMVLNTQHENDTIILTNDLSLSSDASLSIIQARFFSSDHAISCGSFLLLTDQPKQIELGESNFNLVFGWHVLSNQNLELDADSSIITIKPENLSASFYGHGENYHHLLIEATDDAEIQLFGSNYFNFLSLGKGLHMEFEKSSTQSIEDSLYASGSCISPIDFTSSEEGTQAMLILSTSCVVEAECLSVQDIKLMGSQTPYAVYFSEDHGNNNGWNFSASPATVAGFNTNYHNCFGDTILFQNTSTAFDGKSQDLSFTWYFDDGDTLSSVSDISHYFDTEGKHNITLRSTYRNDCSDEYSDSIYIQKPQIILDVDESDFRICLNDSVTFSCIGEGDSFNFFINNLAVGNFQTDSFYSTSLLQDGDEITAMVMDGGCSAASSNSIIFTVDSIPDISFYCSDADLHICRGDSVQFTAQGADYYQFYRNGQEIGVLDTMSSLVLGDIENGDSISVSGKFNGNGCQSVCSSSFVFILHELPMVGLTSSDADQIICAGDSTAFYATGALNYQFYIDDMAQNSFSMADSFQTNNILYSTSIYCLGQSAYGCVAKSNTVNYSVNPVPSTTLSCSDKDLDICAGDAISFNASGASLYEFFLDGQSLGAASSVNYLNLNNLTDYQKVEVKGYINACSAFADSSYRVHVRPKVIIQCSDQDYSICDGDVVEFNVSGDSQYQFFLDNQAITAMGSNSQYVSDSLKDGQIFHVEASTGACLPNPLVFSVHPVPAKVSLLCDDADQLICEGDKVNFTAGGAFRYQFFIDTLSAQQMSTNTNFSTSVLKNNEVVTVVGYSDKGCSTKGDSSYRFSVNPYPQVQLSSSDADEIICKNDSVVFTASGADSFRFIMGTDILQDFSINPVFGTRNLKNGAEFMVIGKSKNCQTRSDSSFTFRVYNQPVIDLKAVSGTELCEDENIELSAFGANNYEYYVDNTLISSNSSGSFSYLPQNSSHRISVKGESNGCYNWSDTALQFNIYDYPVVVFQSSDSDNEICYGEEVTFSATGAETYAFYKNNHLEIHSTDTFYSPRYVKDGDQFSLEAFNAGCGTKAGNTFNMTVHKMNLNLYSDQSSNMLCEGNPVVFKASGGDAYQFTLDGISQGSFSTVDSFMTSSLTDGQRVGVIAKSNQSGCEQKADIRYRMNILATPHITPLSSTTFCKGDSVLLASNYPTGNAWYKDGNLIQSGTENLIVREGGQYSLLHSEGATNAVLAFGNNAYGQLGNNTSIHSFEAVRAQLSPEIAAIDGGKSFSMALTVDGHVYTWGSNTKGQLGDASYSRKTTPVKLSIISDCRAIAAGGTHCLALLADSSLLSWGNNEEGQLGYGNNAVSNFPMQVNDLRDVVQIAAGENHSLLLKADGSVWAFGDNRFGQLGDSSFTDRNKAVQVKGLQNIVKIACGANHNLAVDQNQQLWVWGNNAKGQLGLSHFRNLNYPEMLNTSIPIVDVDAGVDHSLLLSSYAELYSFGSNEKGQLGVTGISQSNIPVLIELDACVQTISCGAYHNFAIEKDGTVWAWGYNHDGQLGNGNSMDQFSPVLLKDLKGILKMDAAYNHSMALQANEVSCISTPLSIVVDTFPDVVIFYEALGLKTVEGKNYQWYFNGNPIPGATSRYYNPMAYGNYQVFVEFDNGCSAMSEAFVFSSLKEMDLENSISIQPNPNKGLFRLELNMNSFYLEEISRIDIIDALGQQIQSLTESISQTEQINIGEHGAGMYLIQIQMGDALLYKKVIVR
jgi:alpha-tubulin suppressor-like RCC1 family protein